MGGLSWCPFDMRCGHTFKYDLKINLFYCFPCEVALIRSQLLCSKEDIVRAQAFLMKTKNFDKESIPASGNTEQQKYKPIVLSSHKEFHKTASTGMTVGQDYSVYKRLGKRGWSLAELNERGRDNRYTRVLIKNSFTGKRARVLYDLRNKYGCFIVVMLENGEIHLRDFKGEKC